MRDVNRIRPFLNELAELWEENRDLRFGQLVTILADTMGVNDIFFPEEVKWIEAINSLKRGD